MIDDPIEQRIAADMQELKRQRLRRQLIARTQSQADGRPRCTDVDDRDPLLAALKNNHQNRSRE